VALFLLGVVWGMPGRRLRAAFLAVLAAVAGAFILLEAGACLWWRYALPELWERNADARGALMQSTGWTCLPASAVMLLHQYGIPASEGELAYLANTTLFGTDEYVMARALNAKLRARGWRARVEEATYEECVRRGEPFIAHVEPPDIGNHAILVERAWPDGVEVIDPLDGIPRNLPRAAFEEIWDGTLLRLTALR
jgi:ABC-type bacteriocin/lantibiotic exporter with double-glycine peptidase domain